MSYPFDPPVEPMLAKAGPDLPAGDGWLFEPKWDGFRALAFRGAHGELYLRSRELEPLREGALDGHPWRDWAAQAGEDDPAQRMPGAESRWNRGKDMRWEPVRVERVCEVVYDHLQGPRFRHAARFLRWRPDRTPGSCRHDRLEVTPPYELAPIFGRD